MMVERSIIVDHSTLHRWVIRLVPFLDKAQWERTYNFTMFAVIRSV
jgi:transposase-like protein